MAETDVSHSCLKGADMQTLCTWEIVMNLYAEFAHRMGGSDDPRRVHFQSPAYLVERLDAIADLFDKDRTDVLVEAIREYIEDTADSETFQELVATKYYDDQLDFETVKQLVDAETAQRLRLLKSNLEDEPLELGAPNEYECTHQPRSPPGRRGPRYRHGPGPSPVSPHVV